MTNSRGAQVSGFMIPDEALLFNHPEVQQQLFDKFGTTDIAEVIARMSSNPSGRDLQRFDDALLGVQDTTCQTMWRNVRLNKIRERNRTLRDKKKR